MISEEQKPGGKRKLIKQIKGKYNQLYNGAWNELDLSKSSKRALAGAGMILLIGAMASYSIITKND
jgi:hypothetical protein